MLYDLGFSHSVDSLVSDLSFGTLYAIATSTGGNPFSPNQKTYSISYQCDLTAVEQMNAIAARQMFGIDDHVFYKTTIATPEQLTSIKSGMFVLVKSPLQNISGIIRRIDHQISGASIVYIDESENVPNQASILI